MTQTPKAWAYRELRSCFMYLRQRRLTLYNPRTVILVIHELPSSGEKPAFFKGFGAGEGNRTLDTQLGKLMFCH